MKTFISIITKMFANMILDEIEKLSSMLNNVETIAHDFVNQLDVDTIREILPIVKALHDAGETDEEIVQAIMFGKPQFEQDLANETKLDEEKFRQDLKALSIMTGVDFSSIFDDLEGNETEPEKHEVQNNADEDQDDFIDALTQFLSGTNTVPMIIRVRRK